jgi:glycosyltransferase involved in cell wall biosynthesis
MACEVPVVGSDSGEIPRVVADAGLIFREGDEADLGEKLARLMADGAQRRDLARRGRERALARYASVVIARKTHEVYVKVLEGRG